MAPLLYKVQHLRRRQTCFQKLDEKIPNDVFGGVGVCGGSGGGGELGPVFIFFNMVLNVIKVQDYKDYKVIQHKSQQLQFVISTVKQK